MCPQVQGRRGHPGYCGHITPSAGSRKWGHPGVFGHATLDEGSVRWAIPGDFVCLSPVQILECAHETQSAVSGEGTDRGKYRHVSQCIWSGMGSSWRLDM